MEDEKGDGFVGFIHQVVIDQYLSKHDAPEDIELYFCGPPLMNQAVQKMGEDFGIPDESIRFDDCGGQNSGEDRNLIKRFQSKKNYALV